jgi:hypothetical protein
MTKHSETKPHHNTSKEPNQQSGSSAIYIPEIHLLGTGYRPGQIISVSELLNFNEQEANDWLEEQTVRFAKLEQMNKQKYAYITKVVRLERR